MYMYLSMYIYRYDIMVALGIAIYKRPDGESWMARSGHNCHVKGSTATWTNSKHTQAR